MSLFGEMPHIFSTAQMLGIVDREIKMRERVYPRQVDAGKMSQSKADFELEGMKQIRTFIAGRGKA